MYYRVCDGADQLDQAIERLSEIAREDKQTVIGIKYMRGVFGEAAACIMPKI